MRTRSILVPTAFAALGALALGACGGTSPSFQTSANGTSGTATSVASNVDDTAATDLPVDVPGDTTPAGDPSSNGNTGGGSSGGNTGGGSGGGGGTAPQVTGASASAVNCPAASGTASFTAHYTVVNAKNIEYLAPGSDRPGATAATGSVMFNYDCSKPSQVFKIRAFNEFNGSDSKNPSPYVSFTVTRKLATTTTSSSSTSSSSSSSSTSSTAAPKK